MLSRSGQVEEIESFFGRGQACLVAIDNFDQLAILLARWAMSDIRCGRLERAEKHLANATELTRSQSFSEGSEAMLVLREARETHGDAKVTHRASKAPEHEATLVFTDIVGTTKIWEALGTDFEPILRLHDGIIIRYARRNGGYLVKNSGDSFFIAFEETEQAVQFAIEIQKGLREAPWPPILQECDGCETGLRVRIGLHRGDVETQRNAEGEVRDYFGPTVNRAARITRVSTGVQVVFSHSVLEKAQNTLEGSNFSRLPDQPLKGFSDSIPLYALVP
jgi:class 3 adenylate cyclase